MSASASGTRLWIIGVGDEGVSGLTELARQRVDEADVLLGAGPTLRLLDAAAARARRVVLDPDMTRALDQVKDAMRAEHPVLVSYGDPLFFGVTRYLIDRLGKDSFEVLPHVSSMQLAFARVKESWDDAYLASLEGPPIEQIIDRIRTAEKVGLFSSATLPPRQLARLLLDHGIDYFSVYVCEHLGQPDERVTHATLAELTELDFDPLHVLVLVRQPGSPDLHARGLKYRLFGNPDDAFAQSRPKRSLVTQAEVRAIALSQMDLHASSVVWDIGAGSGSVSIEAAQLAPLGVVHAVEPDPADLALLLANCERFGVSNVRTVPARAPECLDQLPDPDAVFVGGTGRQVGTILKESYARLRPGGNLVVNLATIESLVTAHSVLKGLASEVRVWNVTLARGIEQMDRVRFQSINPTFLLAVSKPR